MDEKWAPHAELHILTVNFGVTHLIIGLLPSWKVKDMPSMRFPQWTQMAGPTVSKEPFVLEREWTYNLELDGNYTEVQDLYRRPQNEIGLERRQVNVTHFINQCPSASSLSQCHESEKAEKT